MEKFTRAWDQLNDCLIDINDLTHSRNGRKCECTCVECNEPLEACQGYIRSWYFRHKKVTDCNGGPITALHLLAQELLTGEHTILTTHGPVNYSDATTEFAIPSSQKRADVSGTKDDGNRFAVEILVTHQVDEVKRELYRDQRLHSIEIDLSEIGPNIKKEDLLNLLLNDTSIQCVIYAPEIEPDPTGEDESITSYKAPKASNYWVDILFGASLIGAFFYLYRKLFPSRSPRRRHSNIMLSKRGPIKRR